MEEKKLTLKQRINRYLSLMDENDPLDEEKLKLILSLIDRVFVGIPIW